ncbi:peptide-methionine (S)-S-oxide reductase [Paenibacillus macquariensis]|uniref:Peptide methionine sulfoxide reductase MsrA n=2 Tax=Paenibacillus macquariensis TaxID=948756 RepID=A0ABY1K5U4_9BACL|nr:peptide-methionine (S)-S-oxide reductase [Paenibacillus macquariensis]MEC0090525.1 peptide-methionine (S)-S-oxide reductase [Paenibacillus macquariensis]SIR30587.1 peptide-methionine (S)-S-oxide reductase [Paenibacillus macquariensis]
MNQGSQHNITEPSKMDNSFHTISLGMGCFWGPDALFGHLPGVIRTRVGYAGGTTSHPTYRQMGDHTEIVEMDFEPDKISLEDILNVFWNHHNPVNINDYKGRQYMSLLLYHDEEQRSIIQRVTEEGKGETLTSIAPYSGFHLAEDKHQKYHLKRYPDALEKLGMLYSSHDDLVNATLVARLNGLAKGYTSLERIINEIEQWSTHSNHQQIMTDVIRTIRW